MNRVEDKSRELGQGLRMRSGEASMRGRKSAQELAGPRDRLRRLIAKVHAANRPHLQRVKMSIEEIAHDRLGGDVEPDFTQAAREQESGDGGPAIGSAELERDSAGVTRRPKKDVLK
jgi:hypothetical protein